MHSTTITYINGFVYKQTDTITNAGKGTDSLQFIAHEEGRARWAYHKYTTGSTAYGFEYDFFERDHLGNIRTVLSQERDTTKYLASMEAAYRSTETQLFGNITNTSYAWNEVPYYQSIPSQTMFAYTNPNDSVSKVDSSSSGGQKTGPSLLLKVMSGDSLQIGVQCFYNSGAGGGTNNSSFNNVLSSLTNALATATTAGAEQGSSAFFSQPGSSVYTGLTSFLTSKDSVPANYPKAYINWIFLDDQFNYVSGLSGSVQAASSNYPAGQLNFVAPGSQLALNRNGYLYIWVSNETQGWDVFFDNLAVQYKQGPLLEENHYYPFGLTMAGISDKAIKTCYAENKFRYNEGTELQNKEFSDGAGLEVYDAGFRTLDPQLGRFNQIDPMADMAQFSSNYAYAANSPVSANDPSGLLKQNPQQQAEENALMSSAVGGSGGGGGSDVDESMDASDDLSNFGAMMGDAAANGGNLGQVAFDQASATQMAQITPNLAGMFPELPYMNPGFQGATIGMNNAGNSVLRISYNYGVLSSYISTGGISNVVVKSIVLSGSPGGYDFTGMNAMFMGEYGINFPSLEPSHRFITTQKSHLMFNYGVIRGTAFGGYTKEIGEGLISEFSTIDNGEYASEGIGVHYGDNSASLNYDIQNGGFFIDVGVGPTDVTFGISLLGGFSMGHSQTGDDGLMSGANYSIPFIPTFGPVGSGSSSPVPEPIVY